MQNKLAAPLSCEISPHQRMRRYHAALHRRLSTLGRICYSSMQACLASMLLALLAVSILAAHMMSSHQVIINPELRHIYHFGKHQPIPTGVLWMIAHDSARRPPTSIRSSSPQLEIQELKSGGYKLLLYDRPSSSNAQYRLRVREAGSRKEVILDDNWKPQESRLISSGKAIIDKRGHFMALQELDPLIGILGNKELPYAVHIELYEQNGKHITAQLDCIIKGDFCYTRLPARFTKSVIPRAEKN